MFFLIASISFYYLARSDLGKLAPSNAWNTWAYKRNVYNSYSDTKKSVEVSGYYEYIVRDIYLSKIDNLFSDNSDVLPTIAYLFGLEPDSKYFIGKNIFDKNYRGYVFFNDYSWYDGEVYYKNDQVIEEDNEYIKNITKQINEVIEINKMILETNYFGNIND